MDKKTGLAMLGKAWQEEADLCPSIFPIAKTFLILPKNRWFVACRTLSSCSCESLPAVVQMFGRNVLKEVQHKTNGRGAGWKHYAAVSLWWNQGKEKRNVLRCSTWSFVSTDVSSTSQSLHIKQSLEPLSVLNGNAVPETIVIELFTTIP